jgi:hypothetical protein
VSCGLDDWGSRVRFPEGLGIFLFTTASRTALGPTKPPTQWIPGAHSLGVERPGHETDHSLPSSAGGQRMSGDIPPLPNYTFMTWCSVKVQGQLYLFYLYIFLYAGLFLIKSFKSNLSFVQSRHII